MIAYLDKYDTTVDIPDNASDKDVQDINENFHSYVDTTPAAGAVTSSPAAPPSEAKPYADLPPELQQRIAENEKANQPTEPQWKPNFYEGVMSNLIQPVKVAGELLNPRSQEAEAFAGKAAEELSFGALTPFLQPRLSAQFALHPAFADAGAMVGGVGSLMEGGALLKAAGLAGGAVLAGRGAVEAGLAAGERFIPRAIMTGATFGTRTFIAETVKAFQEGGVDLEQFGKDVLKDTAFGAIFGSIGGLTNAAASISSAGALGFISSKMGGADNREATLNGAIWAAFETVGSVGKSEALRMEALGNLKESIGEYINDRNPGLGEGNARSAASQFVDQAITKAGFDNAEDIAKSGPANLLEGIEKVNQIVRTAKIPAEPGAEAPLLPKLPAPVEPETPKAPTPTEPKPQTPIEKAIEAVKGMMGIKGPEEIPAEQTKEITAFEQAKIDKAGMEKGLGEIAERFENVGIKPNEGAAIFNAYQINKKGQFGQFQPLSDQLTKPMEEQYQDVYKALAEQRGIETEKPNTQTMEQARHAVDLINAYFNPKSQEIKDFVAQHPDASIHDIAQMAYNRGLIEEPNPDLLEMEVKKAKQEKILGMVQPPQPPPSPQSTVGTPPTQPGKMTASEEFERTIFPGPQDPTSNQSLTSKPEYRKMRTIATEIVTRYAKEQGVTPDNDFANRLHYDMHVEINKPRLAETPEAKMAAYKEVMAKYPNIEKDFPPLADQIKSDGYETGYGWFDKNVKQNYPVEMKTQAMLSPGAAVQPEPLTVAQHVQEAAKEISTIANPANAAPLAAQITREQLGKMARAYDMAEAALEDAHNLFQKQSKEQNLSFIDNLERGKKQTDAKLQGVADTLRKLLDDKRKEINDLGTGKLKAFIENYFPHIWDQGEKQVSQGIMKAAKRPFEGSKSFLKKRSIEFTKDGIEMGLTPVSYNPVDLAMIKLREMDKYIMAHRTIKEYKANGLAKYVKVGDDAPEGWQKIDDRISTIFKSPMVAVQEAFDEKVMTDLNSVAKSLGIDLERSQRMKAEGQRFKDAWGLSMSSESQKPGKIWTKFAGPESALAHEIGHQIDNIYGLQAKFLSDPKIASELAELANERIRDVAFAKESAKTEYQGEGLSQSANAFRKYVQTPEEKMAAMLEAYIHAPELMKEIAPNTYAKLDGFLKETPKLAPLSEIKPSLVLGTAKGEVYAGGSVIAGHIYAQPDAARIINNYLSPGLQKSAIYQAWRYAGNLINQFQLGMSAFHLGFTSLDATVSKVALGLEKIETGSPLKGLKDILASPFAPVTNIIRGNELLKAWRGEGQSQSDNVLAEAMASGGGRARMDQFYATRAYEQMKHHFEAGRYVQGLLHIPLSIAEISSKPILEYIVPRQKLGVFSDLMKMEFENHPNMSHEEMRALAQRAWDSVDNRMGQLVYDNLFWNRTFKDLLMGSTRSVGWNLGTVREIGGGVREGAGVVHDLMSGKRPEELHKLNYDIALTFVVGLLGAITTYLITGKGPQELKDYYFPPTGGLDQKGDRHRSSYPSYMKDVYHYTQAPIQTVLNKATPLIAMMAQMWQNKDFYGTKIRNEDDPVVKQVAAEATYILKQMTPFSIRNMMKNQETGNKSLFDTVGPWVGITPAPYDIDQTKAEKLAHEIAMSHQQIGGRTEEQMERSRLVSDLTRQYKLGNPQATSNLYKAYESGAISHHQMQEVLTNAHLTPLQRMVKNMTLDETERVYAKANDEEKGQIESALNRKRLSKEREFVAH